MKKFIKSFLKKTFFKPGTIQSVLFGPLRGKKFIVNDVSSWSHIYGREHYAQKAFERFIKKNYVVYDFGANTGMHSLLFSQLVGDSGKVFSFEPLPENINEINSLVRLNAISNITLIKKAVSNFSGTAQFDEGSNNFQGSLAALNSSTRKILVQVTSLDDFLDQGYPMPNFIKIDIEGGEGNALNGFERWIQKCRPIFSIELHSPEQDLLVGNFLKKYSYKVFRLRNTETKSKKLLSEIRYLDRAWPDPEGIWGTVIAFPDNFELSKII